MPEPVSRQSGMVSGQNRRQKMRGVASLGLFNDGIALRHALKAVNGLSNTAEKGTSQKKNTEETRHIRNLLNSGRCLRGFLLLGLAVLLFRSLRLCVPAGCRDGNLFLLYAGLARNEQRCLRVSCQGSAWQDEEEGKQKWCVKLKFRHGRLRVEGAGNVVFKGK